MTPANPRVDETLVRTKAFELWLARGCPIGSPEIDWFSAMRWFEDQTRDLDDKSGSPASTAVRPSPVPGEFGARVPQDLASGLPLGLRLITDEPSAARPEAVRGGQRAARSHRSTRSSAARKDRRRSGTRHDNG
jgi:hypothetical protein